MDLQDFFSSKKNQKVELDLGSSQQRLIFPSSKNTQFVALLFFSGAFKFNQLFLGVIYFLFWIFILGVNCQILATQFFMDSQEGISFLRE